MFLSSGVLYSSRIRDKIIYWCEDFEEDFEEYSEEDFEEDSEDSTDDSEEDAKEDPRKDILIRYRKVHYKYLSNLACSHSLWKG